MSRRVPRPTATLCLTFAGDGLGPARDDDAWGLASVRVEAYDAHGNRVGAAATTRPADERPFALPVADEMARAFDDACDDDRPGAGPAAAFQRLVLGGDAAVDAIRAARIPPQVPPDAAAVRAIVARLRGIGRTYKEMPEAWREPDAAEEELVALGWPAEPLLASIQAERALPQPQANRLNQAIRRIRTQPLAAGHDRRRQVALRALAILDTPAARTLAATLAPR